MVSCRFLLCSPFITLLQRNSFAIITTAFALMPLARASIRAAEQGFPTQRHLDEVIPGAIVISLSKEFESIMTIELDFIF
jgi:hypothetical protein